MKLKARYANQKLELDQPLDLPDGSEVEVEVCVSNGTVNLRERGIDEAGAADLRRRLAAFAEDWDRPEMNVYGKL